MKDNRFTGFKPRAVGLTRSYAGGSPLTKIGGKAYRPERKSSTPEQPKMPSTKKPEANNSQYDEITAPPESSDTEAGATPLRKATLSNDDISDEEYEQRRTADILKTDFSSRAFLNARSGPNRRTVRPPRKTWPRKFHLEEPSSSTEPKQTAEDDEPRALSQLSQLEKEAEEARNGKGALKRKKQTNKKYGTQAVSSRSNLTKPKPCASLDDDDELSTPKRQFQHPKSLSPIKTDSPPRKFLKSNAQSFDFEEAESARPRFKKVPIHDFSPDPMPPKGKLRELSPLDEDHTTANANLPSLKGRGRQTRIGRLSKGKLKVPDHLSEFDSEESQRPVFKVPGLQDIDPFDDANLSDVPIALSDQQVDLSDHLDQLDVYEVAHTTIPRCPLCNEEVDRAFFEKHSTKGKMNVKQQTNFCRLHKRKSAMKLGVERGYPDIDWEKFDVRCAKHQKSLQDILQGVETSHYRGVFKDKVESGKNRTLFTNTDNLTPGYYGPRGLLAMTDFIVRTLSPIIRKRAVEDRLISARSYMGYVQAVLVPELAVRLIMEDMSVSKDRARKILEESVEIGELLHEETRDVVTTGAVDDEDKSESDDEDDEPETSTDEDELAFS